ncbi:MAG TPA: hypothetical protein VKE51_35630 [Vicinamibacterales bacterium]|nr:hypothetical protein [Vicinamibacterales bacterium]
MNLWIDVAVMATIFALGNILFGHFEEKVPKWRRVLKFFVLTGGITLISATAGRTWSIGLVGGMFVLVAIIHGWWLPKQGINGFTAEPKEKYYALRGWKL